MSSQSETKTIAVVHSAYLSYGGAERVADEIARTFDAPIYTGYLDPDVPPDDNLNRKAIFPSWMLRFARQFGFFREAYSYFAWQNCSELTDFDVLIQTAPAPGTYVPLQDQVVVRYVHDLPRTAYDRYQLDSKSLMTQLSAHLFRIQYTPYIKFADQYIANSEYIQNRIEKYWDVTDSVVIYPPVRIGDYMTGKKSNIYLTYSRLTERKRIQNVVEAFASLPEKTLIVGGDGPMEGEIRQRAQEFSNIDFEGYLSEQRKRDLLSKAKAVIYPPTDESFGIVPVEAFASGTPVIGANAGYTKYHIDDGETGILFDPPATPEAIAEAVKRFDREGVTFTPDDLISIAKKYNVNRFRDQIEGVVKTTRVS